MAWEPKPEQICSEAGVYYTREDQERYFSPDLLWTYLTTWQKREEFRLDTGIYQDILWFTVPSHFMIYKEARSNRYPHIPKSEPGKIAYTENDVKGNRDIQTVTTIGRYLSRFHDYLSDTEKKQLVDEWNSYYDNTYQLSFSDDPETIAKIYINGPSSCMSKNEEDFLDDTPFGKHPCEAYGKPGDLSIAYLGTTDNCVARAIVDVQNKYFVRAYGFVERIELKLKDAGFTKQAYWNSGTKLNLWQDGSRILCPYLDGQRDYCNVISNEDGFLLITDDEYSGSVQADTTDGFIDFNRNICNCHHCNGEIDTDFDDYFNIDDNTICSNCVGDHYIYCRLTGQYVSNDTDMAVFYDRYGYEELGQLSELENSSLYYLCDYTYEVEEETRFYYHANTNSIELNDGRTITVATNLHDEAYSHYLEKGLIDVEEEEEVVADNNKEDTKVEESTPPSLLLGHNEYYINVHDEQCVRWVPAWGRVNEAA